MTDTLVALGGFVFSGDFAVPENINGGGAQHLITHKFIGGARVLVALGADDDTIHMAGRFRGAAAQVQIRLLDIMRRAGKPVVFTYWTYRYQVIVSKLTWRFERFYEIVYDLELTVISDLQAAAMAALAQSLDSLFGSDMDLAGTIGNGVSTINTALAAVNTAKAAAGSLSGLTASGLSGVVGAVGAATAVATTASGAAESLAGAFGGVSPGLDPAAMASGLLTQANGFLTAATGVQVGAVLGRISTNLSAVIP